MNIGSFKYTELNPSDPVGDFFVKMQVLDEIIADPCSKKDAELLKEVSNRRAALVAEAEFKGIFRGRSY